GGDVSREPPPGEDPGDERAEHDEGHDGDRGRRAVDEVDVGAAGVARRRGAAVVVAHRLASSTSAAPARSEASPAIDDGRGSWRARSRIVLRRFTSSRANT